MADDWYDRHEDTQPSGRVYIHLTCHDCGTSLRLVKSPAGEERAAALIAVHKPSGCCDERAAAKLARVV